jgi:hypothetical protein
MLRLRLTTGSSTGCGFTKLSNKKHRVKEDFNSKDYSRRKGLFS